MPTPKKPTDPRYWIAVVPKVGVDRCLAGGFAMFAHGRHDAVMRTKAGEWLAYYSPRTLLKGGEEVRAFTAIGKFTEREPYEAEMMPGRVGWRRDIAFEKRGARGRRLSAPRRALLHQGPRALGALLPPQPLFRAARRFRQDRRRHGR